MELKPRLRYCKYKLTALWWLLTRKNYYLVACGGDTSRFIESYNVMIPEFVEWIKERHGMLTNKELILELKSIAYLVKKDKLAYEEAKSLIERVKDWQDPISAHQTK